MSASNPLLRRRHRRLMIEFGDDIGPLVRALGGDAVVTGFYDTRFGVTQNGSTVSQWDDARGTIGHGPSFTLITGAAPNWTPATLAIGAGGGSLATAASSLFDLSTGFTLALVSINTRVTGQYIASIADAVTRTRQMAAKNIGGVSGNWGGAFFTGGAEQTTPLGGADVNAAQRVVSIIKCSGTTGSGHMMNLGVQSVAITAEGAGANRLTLFDYFPGGAVQASEGQLRAVLAIKKATSLADDAAIRDWALQAHPIVTVY